MTPLRAVAEKAPVRTAHRTMGGFDIAVQKRALTHVDRPGRICTKSADDMMRVMIVKSAEHNLLRIRPVVPIGVLQQHQIRALRDVDAFRSELKSCRKVEPRSRTPFPCRPCHHRRCLRG